MIPSPSPNPVRGLSRAAFTLIEMMVVMALLGVILTITVTISTGSTELIGKTRARIAADEIAATTFDQIALDLHQRVVRREATVRLVKRAGGSPEGGNDELVLLTTRSGYPLLGESADRRVSAVHYRVQQHQLVQAASGYDFGSAGSQPDESNGTLKIFGMPEKGPADLRDGWFETMVPGVIRMEFTVVARNGSERVLADPPDDFRDVEALVVSLVVLDPKRTRFLKPQQRDRIAREFPDAVNGTLPLERWTPIERDLANRLPAAEVPRAALRHVRVYQRHISLRTASAL